MDNKPKKSDQTMSTIFIKSIPRTLKSNFKAYCARRDKSMTQVLLRFMRDSVAKNEPTSK